MSIDLAQVHAAPEFLSRLRHACMGDAHLLPGRADRRGRAGMPRTVLVRLAGGWGRPGSIDYTRPEMARSILQASTPGGPTWCVKTAGLAAPTGFKT